MLFLLNLKWWSAFIPVGTVLNVLIFRWFVCGELSAFRKKRLEERHIEATDPWKALCQLGFQFYQLKTDTKNSYVLLQFLADNILYKSIDPAEYSVLDRSGFATVKKYS